MFIWIQILRGLAAAMVVCHHYVAAQAERGVQVGRGLSDFGGSGVDIFFVISGFIMSITQPASGRPHSARRFLLRRLARIAPLYWLLTAAAFVLAILASHNIHSEFEPGKLLMSLLFLPYSEHAIDMAAHGYRAYVIPMAWTLTYEWLFYLLFAVALALRLQPAARLLFIAGCFAAGVLAGRLYRPDEPLLQVLSSPLLFEFLLGCAVAWLYQRRIRLHPWLALLLALPAALVLSHLVHDSATARILVWGAAACALVAAAALTRDAQAAPPAMLQPLVRLGDLSYALYLSHFFTLALFVRLQQQLAPLSDGLAVPALFAFTLLSWLVASLCHHCIEQPSRAWLGRGWPYVQVAGR